MVSGTVFALHILAITFVIIWGYKMPEISSPTIIHSSVFRVLFVDDMADTRNLFRFSLSIAGHDVHAASDGLEAVSAVQDLDSFDVIIMDIEMPGMNGWDAVRAIRELPKGSSVPILMFTAYDVSRSSVEKVGANDVIYKPVSPPDLLKRINQAVNSTHIGLTDNQSSSLTPEIIPVGL